MACDFLALGLDPEKSTFWIQSDIPEVTRINLDHFLSAGVGLMDGAAI